MKKGKMNIILLSTIVLFNALSVQVFASQMELDNREDNPEEAVDVCSAVVDKKEKDNEQDNSVVMKDDEDPSSSVVEFSYKEESNTVEACMLVIVVTAFIALVYITDRRAQNE